MTTAINIDDALERDLVSPDEAERLQRQLGENSRWSFDAHKTIDYRAQLARLLAAENITIEHNANAPTAAFDIKNRVLILPTWKEISKEVYDLLVLHEVGHALYTPLDGWHNAVRSEGPEFKSYLNVLEDARIEKKIKRKYPGGRRSFVQGYADLLNRDFFGLKDRDINSFGFIDRINMHFKGGSLLDIEFTDAEKVWVARIAKAETWSEVEKIARELWDSAKEEAETDRGGMIDVNPGDSDDDEEGESFAPSDDSDDSDGDGESPFGDDDPDGESDTDGESADGSGAPDEDADDASDGGSGGSGDSDDSETSEETDKDNKGTAKGDDAANSDADSDDADSDDADSDDAAGSGDMAARSSGKGVSEGKPFSETDKAWRDNEGTLVDTSADNVVYVTLADDDAYNLDEIIISHDEIWAQIVKAQSTRDTGSRGGGLEAMANAKSDLSRFKNGNSKVITYMAKEFEMKKAAEASARAATSRTGVLDTNCLHSYKWNEDVFKKITSIPEGKNHGLVLFMDWSGSMTSNMFGSIEQILTILMFCKKVNIPCDVYAFTSGAPWMADRLKMRDNRIKVGDYDLNDTSFNLMHLASSHVKVSKYNEMLLGLIMLRGFFNHGGRRVGDDSIHYFPMPRLLYLGGTPLNECIATAIPVVNKFRAVHKLQIVNTVFLTDGEGSGLRDVRHADGSTARPAPGRVILRDRKTHKEFSAGYYTEMQHLMEMFRLRTGSKIVNFYITAPQMNSFKREWRAARTGSRYADGAAEAENAAWKVAKIEGGAEVEGQINGWDALYFILGGASMSIQDEGLSKDLVGAKKASLKKAFAKAAIGKLRNRVLLRSFIELIAK
jgi:hypothetical protein